MRHRGVSRSFEEIAGALDAIVNTLFSFLLCKKIERKPRGFLFFSDHGQRSGICMLDFLDLSADGLLFLLTARLTCDVFHRSG